RAGRRLRTGAFARRRARCRDGERVDPDGGRESGPIRRIREDRRLRGEDLEHADARGRSTGLAQSASDGLLPVADRTARVGSQAVTTSASLLPWLRFRPGWKRIMLRLLVSGSVVGAVGLIGAIYFQNRLFYNTWGPQPRFIWESTVEAQEVYFKT